MTQELADKIEVISINDSKSETEEIGPIVPHERQIVDSIISIWKEDPSTENLGISKLHSIVKSKHSNWSISEKRIRQLLKKFGLSTNQEQFTYSKYITSELTFDIELPSKIQVVMTNKRGKCLYAKKSIKKGELIWNEIPLFFIPPLVNVKLIKNGSACSYCGKLLKQIETKSILKGLDCNICSEIWCSKECKLQNIELHNLLKHNLYNPNNKKSKLMDSNSFLELQDYCLEESWNALYAITLIYAQIILDKSGILKKQFNSMAKVSQDIRYKALNSSGGTFDNMNGGTLFIQEQQEILWNQGFEKFLKIFPKNPIDFKEFLFMMGTYNINNLDSNIYLIQSHLNHNCEPNLNVETDINRIKGIKVYASRDIKEGEELTTTYVNPIHTVNQRQRELRVNWGFICNCSKCINDLELNKRRKSSNGSNNQQNAKNIRNMLKETSKTIGENGIELNIPQDGNNGERRKSVRFDEKVVAVSN
ncbi:SET5 [Candida pseudojiufengensis]|uniref:SET5 n=1 Tax=Candida pseudojiufengensis TaxID=497109 RepID=UPI002225A83A|nr:SET5 [Candida pseudojiufengensis]KAI5964366.1 SET5 [Candida pseudojiufengensis]